MIFLTSGVFKHIECELFIDGFFFIFRLCGENLEALLLATRRLFDLLAPWSTAAKLLVWRCEPAIGYFFLFSLIWCFCFQGWFQALVLSVTWYRCLLLWTFFTLLKALKCYISLNLLCLGKFARYQMKLD